MIRCQRLRQMLLFTLQLLLLLRQRFPLQVNNYQIHLVNQHYRYFVLKSGANYYDERACVSVCVSVFLSSFAPTSQKLQSQT